MECIRKDDSTLKIDLFRMDDDEKFLLRLEVLRAGAKAGATTVMIDFNGRVTTFYDYENIIVDGRLGWVNCPENCLITKKGIAGRVQAATRMQGYLSCMGIDYDVSQDLTR
jgi:hypothetical protein